MKVSMTNGRIGSPVHNDRSFDVGASDHIDPNRSDQNRYVSVHPDVSFEANEQMVYDQLFRDWMEQLNERARRSRHKERHYTAERMLSSRRTRPEEVIMQIGNITDQVSSSILMECFNEWQQYSQKLVGRHCLLLDAALHMDESTPHIHARRVWIYRDRDDQVVKIGQERALEYAGIPLPHPDRPVGRYNNRKIVYTRMMREKWQDICEEHGIQVDREPLHQSHMDRHEFIRRAVEAERERIRQEERDRQREKQDGQPR